MLLLTPVQLQPLVVVTAAEFESPALSHALRGRRDGVIARDGLRDRDRLSDDRQRPRARGRARLAATV